MPRWRTSFANNRRGRGAIFQGEAGFSAEPEEPCLAECAVYIYRRFWGWALIVGALVLNSEPVCFGVADTERAKGDI
ncbi:MAG: hypothetical protein Q4C87_07435 [Actinomycetaceae bacterium]|nr:hypothetical protein [Actinomycetaceae bacterium]